MGNAIYAALSRQSGLMSEMSVVANNIANLATDGYRREGVTFTEHVARTGRGGGAIAMARAGAHYVDLSPGAFVETGGRFDFAIEGPGFFLVEGPEGPLLTRAGSFRGNAAGELVTAGGRRLLDAAGAAVFVPPDAREVGLGGDGTLTADGRPLARLGVFRPADPADLQRRGGAAFEAPGGVDPQPEGRILQGFVESSNTDPVAEIARMIEVQRAYELGRGFLEREDRRLATLIRTLGPQQG